jgi:hypothetical protein
MRMRDVTGSLDWLPPDAPQEASCAWTDAKAWALMLGIVVVAFGCGPLARAASPFRFVGIAVGLLATVYCIRVALTRVKVGPDGVQVRGVTSSRRLPWSAVRVVESGPGPMWLVVVSGRPWRASKRLTARSATSTILHLSDGSTLKPLALTRSLPSRGAENVTRLAQHFASR